MGFAGGGCHPERCLLQVIQGKVGHFGRQISSRPLLLMKPGDIGEQGVRVGKEAVQVVGGKQDGEILEIARSETDLLAGSADFTIKSFQVGPGAGGRGHAQGVEIAVGVQGVQRAVLGFLVAQVAFGVVPVNSEVSGQKIPQHQRAFQATMAGCAGASRGSALGHADLDGIVARLDCYQNGSMLD